MPSLPSFSCKLSEFFQTTLLDSSLLEEFWLGPCMGLFGLMASSCADGQCPVDSSTVPNQVLVVLFRRRLGRHRHLPLHLVPAWFVRLRILLSLDTRWCPSAGGLILRGSPLSA